MRDRQPSQPGRSGLDDLAGPRRIFGLRATGGSMAPAVEEGDVVIVDLDAIPMLEGIVVAETDGDHDGEYILGRLFLREDGVHFRQDATSIDTLVALGSWRDVHAVIAVVKPSRIISLLPSAGRRSDGVSAGHGAVPRCGP